MLISQATSQVETRSSSCRTKQSQQFPAVSSTAVGPAAVKEPTFCLSEGSDDSQLQESLVFMHLLDCVNMELRQVFIQ